MRVFAGLPFLAVFAIAPNAAAQSTDEPPPSSSPPASAPPPISSTPPAKPDDAEAKHAVWIFGDFGFTRSDLGLSGNLGFDRTAANGVLYGLAAGYRSRGWRLGLRWRVQDTTEFTLWSFAAVAGYAFPLRPVTPIISLHVGYAFDQGVEPAVIRSAIAAGAVLPPPVDVKGILGGLDLNASYWVTSFVRLGVFVGADLMYLNRARADLPRSIFGATPEVSNHPLYTDSDTSLGLNLNAGIRGAFDIGLD